MRYLNIAFPAGKYRLLPQNTENIQIPAYKIINIKKSFGLYQTFRTGSAGYGLDAEARHTEQKTGART